MGYYHHETAIIETGCKIGEGTKVWHFCHLMGDTEIGESCIIGQNVFVATRVKIGNRVKIQNNVSVYTGVECEDDVFIGPSAVFTNVLNPRSFVERKEEFRKTVIRRGATIGANATIVCGHEIGEYALIGAGAVVTGDVEPYALMAGVPAKRIGWVSKRGCRLEFDVNGTAQCPESGEIYRLEKERVTNIK